jgi:hypothetical protein
MSDFFDNKNKINVKTKKSCFDQNLLFPDDTKMADFNINEKVVDTTNA